MRRVLKLFGIVALGMLHAACSGEKGTVRIIHAAPGAPAVDIYLQGAPQPALSGLAYQQVSGAIEVNGGNYVFQVRPQGASSDSAPVYTSEMVKIEEKKGVTMVAAGVLGSSTTADAFRLIALEDDFGAPQSGQARVRIVDAAVDTAAIGIDINNDGSLEATGLERFSATAPEGALITAGQELQLAISSTGIPTTTFTLPALPEGGELYIVAAGRALVDSADAQSLALIIADPNGRLALPRQNPIFFVLHATPDAPALDVFLGTRELVSNLDFAQLSGRIQLPPGSYTLDFFANQSGSIRPIGQPIASVPTPQLQAANSYLGSTTGLLTPATGQPPFQLAFFSRGFAIDATNTSVRGVHLSPDKPALDIGLVTGSTLTAIPGLTNLTFPNASAPQGSSVIPGTLTMGIAPTGSSAPVATFLVDLQPKTGVFAIVAGMLSPTGSQKPLILVAVDATSLTWSATGKPPL